MLFFLEKLELDYSIYWIMQLHKGVFQSPLRFSKKRLRF